MNGLLVCAGEWSLKNIGDYIQTVAQEQFFDEIDCYVEREHLSDTECEETINVIMNAWYMWHPESFPPSPKINPLFISMHIVPSIANKMLTEKSIAYLKKYEPIGARDLGTKNILELYGIKSYFSGCLTLTLGLKYKSKIHDETILFVDPYYELGNGNRYFKGWNILYAIYLAIKHYSHIRRIREKFVYEFQSGLSKYLPSIDRLIHLASFYEAYSKLFDDKLLVHAHYISHNVKQADYHYNNDEKMEYARHLIRTYAKAKLVVTSRIHCALPCLGVETPVIFVNSLNLEKGNGRGGSNGRFDGLIELMNVASWTSKGVKIRTKSLLNSLNNGKITMQSVIKNNDDYKKISDELIRKVNNFISTNIIN